MKADGWKTERRQMGYHDLEVRVVVALREITNSLKRAWLVSGFSIDVEALRTDRLGKASLSLGEELIPPMVCR